MPEEEKTTIKIFVVGTGSGLTPAPLPATQGWETKREEMEADIIVVFVEKVILTSRPESTNKRKRMVFFFFFLIILYECRRLFFAKFMLPQKSSFISGFFIIINYIFFTPSGVLQAEISAPGNKFNVTLTLEKVAVHAQQQPASTGKPVKESRCLCWGGGGGGGGDPKNIKNF